MFIKQNRSNLAIGAILIGVGVLFLLGQTLDFLRWDVFWPFIIIGIGATFFAGMVMGGKSTAPLAIPGSIISTVGLILLLQNIFGWWESWSYAWALIVASVGLGIVVSGMWGGKPEVTKDGWKVVRVGVILFVIFGFFFEVLFSVTGVSDRPALFWAFLIAGLGALMLTTRVYRLLTSKEEVTRSERNDLFWPILFVGVGGAAILANFNLLPEFNMLSLLRLWPLLLIAAGLQIIFGRRNAWVSGAMGVLVLAAVMSFIFYGERLGIDTSNAPWGSVVSIGPGERVVGSGTLSEQVRPVDDFDRVSMEGIGVLTIMQGADEKLVVSADNNLQEYILTEVRGNTLHIKVLPNFSLSPQEPIDYTLTVRNLEEISVSGAGEVKVGTLETGDLELDSSGLGNFILDDISAERLDVSISGAGSVEVSGQADRLEVSISGMGDFKGGDLQVNTADISVPGLGSATVWVEEMLEASISGAGNIAYYGNPQVSNRSSGLGTVRGLGDK